MKPQVYSTEQFARMAAVSVRTLRWYDREGLLSPTSRTSSGHRQYTDADLAVLQQILAFKFLGFTLAQIKVFLQHGPFNPRGVLQRQKAMLREQRAHLDMVIEAIEAAERAASNNSTDWRTITHIIQVMQMSQHNEWIEQYFTPEQRDRQTELGERSYSEAAKEKMATWGAWTEADQERIDAQYAALAADLKRLVATGATHDSPEAQDIAKHQLDLIKQFTQGDSDIDMGLKTLWKNNDALPEDEQAFQMPWSAEEGTFLQRAMAVYTERNGS